MTVLYGVILFLTHVEYVHIIMTNNNVFGKFLDITVELKIQFVTLPDLRSSNVNEGVVYQKIVRKSPSLTLKITYLNINCKSNQQRNCSSHKYALYIIILFI